MAQPETPVSIETQSGLMELDLARTAVIVVDMQNDFGSPGGMFDRAGIDTSAIQAAVAPTGRVLDAARRVGIKIVYLKMAFREDLSDAGPRDAPNYIGHLAMGVGMPVHAPDGTASQILIRDTWNTDIVDELRPDAHDTVVYKHRFSGFFETALHQVLQEADVKYLVVTGCTTSVCVESTIRDAMFLDYHSVLLEDCTAEPIGHDLQRSNHDASLFLINVMFGQVANSNALLSALQRLPAASVV